MKKEKQYTGEIPFDYFGNMLERDRMYSHIYLTKNNFINGCLALGSYDFSLQKTVMKVVQNPPADFEITYLDAPQPYRPDVIATIPQHLMVPNYEFDDKLEYVASYKSRSSVGFYFKSLITEKKYPMFQKNFDNIVTKLNGGVLEGRFTFCKRGPAYSIKMI